MVALAAIVSVSDVAGALPQMFHRSREMKSKLEEAASRIADMDGLRTALQGNDLRLIRRILFHQAIQLVNIVLQAFLLTISLVSIAYQENSVPVWVAIAAAVVGVLLLAFTGIAMVSAKTRFQSYYNLVDVQLDTATRLHDTS